MKAAFLIVDMQKAFFAMEACRPSLNSALEYVNATAELFRRQNSPVFIIQDNEAGGGPDKPGFGLFDGLVKDRHDRYVAKDYSNSFWKTSLEQDLKKAGCPFLIVSGFAASGCVLYTYNGALERGFKAALLQHGIAGFKDAHIQMALETCDVISYSVLEHLLKEPALKKGGRREGGA